MSREIVANGSKRSRARWSLLVAVVVSAVFLALALHGVAWSDVLGTLHHMRLGPVGVAVPVLMSSYVLRGLRWAILLRAEAPLPSMIAIWASLVGYLANGFLPARAGEPIRAVLVSRNSAVSTSAALATALTERVVDAAFLTVIAITAIASSSALPEWLRRGAWTMAVAAALGLIGLFVAPRCEPLLDRFVKRLPLSEAWKTRLSLWLAQFLRGLRALHAARRAVPFLGLTLSIWFIDANVAMIVAHAVDLGLTFPQALALLSALGLSTAAPSTPGYLGIYQFVAVSVLEPFGATRSEALVFVVAFQAVLYVVITVGGGLGAWALARRSHAPASE